MSRSASDLGLRPDDVIEAVPLGLLVADAEGTIAVANAELCRMFGYEAGELIGRSVDSLLPRTLRRGHTLQRMKFDRAPTARSMGAGRDLRGMRKDGTEFAVEVGLNPLRAGSVPHVLAVVVDISARKQAQEDIERSNDALERSNRALQQFAFIASHDLQSPLRSIGGFVDLIREKYAARIDDQGRDWMNRVTKAVQHMQSLVSGLLEHSRIDSRVRPFEAVELDAAAADALELLEASIDAAGARVTCEPLPVVPGDRAQLVQLLQNLIGNALQYNRSEVPEVRIRSRMAEGVWRITVEDNGIGIPQAYQEKIFQLFQRLHSKANYPGTGIGLAVCSRVVERHGGRLWVESDGTNGSHFHFTLSAAESGDRVSEPENEPLN